MKIIIGNKYMVDMNALNRITEVESTGSWSDMKYKVKGEPTDIAIVPDANVLMGEAIEEFETKTAVVELEETKKKLADLELKTARTEAVTRILGEKRGLSREDVEEWASKQTLTYSMSQATSDDVRKYIRSKQ